MAGVTGPCPHCQVLIQAPYPVSREPVEQQQPPQSQYVQAPAPQEQVAIPQQELEHEAPQPQHISPPEQISQSAAPEPAQLTESQASPTVLRPEPRQLPNRSEQLKHPARVRRDPSGDIQPHTPAPTPSAARQRRSGILRLVVPLIFVCLSLGVVYGTMKFLKRDPANASKTDSSGEVVRNILPADTEDSFESLTGEDAGGLPAGDPSMSNIGDATKLPVALQAVDGGVAALEVLEKFLAMNSLEERLPHLESKLPEADLVSSVLNGPLQEVQEITTDIRETNALEQLTDYYYYVNFINEEGNVNPQTVLVRTRGSGAPKVVVDPFLDLYGGRFARFAATPTKEAGTFQLIISAGAYCYDEVPDPEKKYTLKILSRDDTKEISKAYFGKKSDIGYTLRDETSGLAYGQAKACTVFMRWNLEDDPKNPFLEALEIKALNWNP